MCRSLTSSRRSPSNSRVSLGLLLMDLTRELPARSSRRQHHHQDSRMVGTHRKDLLSRRLGGLRVVNAPSSIDTRLSSLLGLIARGLSSRASCSQAVSASRQDTTGKSPQKISRIVDLGDFTSSTRLPRSPRNLLASRACCSVYWLEILRQVSQDTTGLTHGTEDSPKLDFDVLFLDCHETSGPPWAYCSWT